MKKEKDIIRFEGIIEELKGKVYNLHIKVPPHIVKHYKAKGVKRFLIHLGPEHHKYGAILPSSTFHYILLNRDDLSKTDHFTGDTLAVSLTADESKYGLPMPEELEEIFRQDEGAAAYFEKLSPGKQRALIHLVSKVKNTASRINKALAIAAHLKEESGHLDFKKLNQLIKGYNRKF